ncbi:hypothetical protein BCR34DRAFT_610336 [Clohesyomyces aquaticus]|uniref:Uncharacterized protein n=1 Tax=Clohesyomyces aquaticus TaxID=1231657 RepID=A0A1Y2A753_9PLEO|nr:hypothetical protein BCR34DRAFT_610336 [Clohesyomyces aquaticus]
MSVKTKQAPAGASSAVNGIASLSDSLNMVQSLKAAMTIFTSHAGFSTLSQLADQIPQQEKNIRKKDDQIKALTAQLDTERKNHVVEQDKELRKFGQMYGTLEAEKATLQGTIEELKGSLQGMNKDMTVLRKELDDVKAKGRELEGKYKAKITKLKEKDQEISDLREQLEVTCARADESSKKLRESRERVAVLEKSLEASGRQHGILEKKFNDTTGALNELIDFGAPLYDVDVGTVAKELENLWKSATSVVVRFLRQELPDEMLQNDWSGLRDDTVFTLQIPLPQSNSEAAKEMRIAMVVGILARLVDRYIFQPTYILDDESGFRELLRRQVAVDDKKEAFTRGMFLSMFPEEQECWAKNGRDRVIEDLIKDVVVHFLAPGDIGSFREELENVVVQAQECWRTVQYCNRRLEPSFRYTHDTNFGWQTFEFQIANPREGNQPVSPVAADDPEDELFVIFPRVYIVKCKQPITPGAVLRKAQFRAAALEARENASQAPFTEPASTRHRPRRSRDMSGSSEGAQGGTSARRFLRKPTWI